MTADRSETFALVDAATWSNDGFTGCVHQEKSVMPPR